MSYSERGHNTLKIAGPAAQSPNFCGTCARLMTKAPTSDEVNNIFQKVYAVQDANFKVSVEAQLNSIAITNAWYEQR